MGVLNCYITYAMDFRFVPSDTCALTSCHVVINIPESTIRALRSNRCVTGRRPPDENHAVRFRQSAENRSRVGYTQPIRGVKLSDATACMEVKASGTSWLLGEDMGRRSPLYEYMSLHPSLTHHWNINPFENKVWKIYIL